MKLQVMLVAASVALFVLFIGAILTPVKNTSVSSPGGVVATYPLTKAGKSLPSQEVGIFLQPAGGGGLQPAFNPQ